MRGLFLLTCQMNSTSSLPVRLHQFEPALLAEIDQFAMLKTVPTDTIIIEPGDPVLFVPIVLSGSIRIVRPDAGSRDAAQAGADSGEMLLYYLNADDACAMSLNSLLAGRTSQIRAVTEERTQLLLVPADRTKDWMHRYGSWRMFVLTTYQKRFDNLLETFDLVAFQQMDQRLLTYLDQRAALTGSHTLYMTH
jgi:CRP/FNR family transcriptional regulator, anaerobic regulatory protein